MRSLTKLEAQEWCAARHICLNERRLPQPDWEISQRQDFKIPADTGRRIALLNKLFRIIPAEHEIIVWFTDWGIWPSSERSHMFERFRDSYGEHRSFSDAPAYVFSPVEREDLISFVGFGILFLWDCHVLTATGDHWLFLSHDEVGRIQSKSLNPILNSFSA